MERSLTIIYLTLLKVSVGVCGYLVTPCREPGPVPNAYRKWYNATTGTASGEMVYKCVDGYVLTSGSLKRTCSNITWISEPGPPVCELPRVGVNNSGGEYARNPDAIQTSSSRMSGFPTNSFTLAHIKSIQWGWSRNFFVLDCNEPRNISATNKTWDFYSANYTCIKNYTPRDIITVICDPALGRWSDYNEFCKAAVNLAQCNSSQTPNKLTTQLAAAALDDNNSTCSATDPAANPTWSVIFSKTPQDVINLDFIFGPDGLNELQEVKVTVENSEGKSSLCSRVNLTKALVNRNFESGKATCFSKPYKPFGTVITLTATFQGNRTGRLQICDVIIRTRPHNATCDFPPRIARLRLLTANQTRFRTNDVMQYECEDGFIPLNGSGKVSCGLDEKWTLPSLVCAEEPDTITTAGFETTNTMIYLDADYEICGILLPIQANITVYVTSSLGVRKYCQEGQSSDDKTFVPCQTCPVGNTTTIAAYDTSLLNLSDAKLYGTSLLNLSDAKLYGRRFQGALECMRANNGIDYKGHWNVTKSGLPCLYWAHQDHNYTENMFPDDGPLSKSENYCRNPGGEKEAPWCYVASDIIWETCSLFLCGKICQLTTDGRDYVGPQSRTIRGMICQNWSNPANPFKRPADFVDENLEHNYCRNPLTSQSSPWCYVNFTVFISSSYPGWQQLPYDLCDIANCPISTSTQIIFLKRSIVGNSNYVMWASDCHNVHTSYFRSTFEFVTETCRDTSTGNFTAVCYFRPPLNAPFWAFVIIACDLYLQTSTEMSLVSLTSNLHSSVSTSTFVPIPYVWSDVAASYQLFQASTISLSTTMYAIETSTSDILQTSLPVMTDTTESLSESEISSFETDQLTGLYVTMLLSSSSLVNSKASETSSSLTAQVPLKTSLCFASCTCQFYIKPTQTLQYDMDMKQSVMKSIENDLKIDKKHLSRSIRLKTSASDSRLTAVGSGILAIVILTTVFVLMIASDVIKSVTSFAIYLRRLRK